MSYTAGLRKFPHPISFLSTRSLHPPLLATNAFVGSSFLFQCNRPSVVNVNYHFARLRGFSSVGQAHNITTDQKLNTGTHFKDSPAFQPEHLPDKSRAHEDWCLFHPVYQPKELTEVQVVRHQPKDLSDRIAAGLVRIVRFGFDTVTRYKPPIDDHPSHSNMRLEELRKARLVMTPQQWLARILFLESIAGVPGMVAAMLRHFKSLRMCGRDGGWIRTLLEEAENERMHLLTFMKIKQPSIIFRAMVLAAQGVFANLFFLAYAISPRSAHRFVGILEEEAVVTYTLAIRELEGGLLPEWENLPAPQIAIDYWRLAPEAKMVDLLYAVRADEANHRFVNHSLANIDATTFNPFAIRQPDGIVRGTKPGLERPELEAWAQKVEDELLAGRQAVEAHQPCTTHTISQAIQADQPSANQSAQPSGPEPAAATPM